MNIGIIAEDDSDVVVMKELTRTMIKPRKMGFKRFVGHGCGKLRKKCAAWADILIRQGCSAIVLVHDLDDHNEDVLRKELGKAVANLETYPTVILIPRREIEAWLLYDAEAIARAFNERKKPMVPDDPERLPDAKGFLCKLVAKEYDKQYLNTAHNELIARNVNVNLLKKSKSFEPYPRFVSAIYKGKTLPSSNPANAATPPRDRSSFHTAAGNAGWSGQR